MTQNPRAEERLNPSNRRRRRRLPPFRKLLGISDSLLPSPGSKCLTLLIEIHPINNTKVLKAVDCRVKVQVDPTVLL